MFDQLTSSIKDEVIEFLFKIQAVREEKVTTVMNPSRQEFLHPEAGGMASAGPTPTQAPEVPLAPTRKNVGPPPAGSRSTEDEALQPYHRDQPKVGRNEPCPCGSGKKYKKCHGA